jgi:hypothetical protein
MGSMAWTRSAVIQPCAEMTAMGGAKKDGRVEPGHDEHWMAIAA